MHFYQNLPSPSTPHVTTLPNSHPRFLKFGSDLELPKALYRENNKTETDLPGNGTNAAAALNIRSERLTKLQKTFKLVRAHLSRAFAKQSYYYNLRRRKLAS